jgi:hypothetical protein
MTPAQEAYQQYLQTPTWLSLRGARLKIDGGKCFLCGKKAVDVHHRRYPGEWGTETVDDLVSLCEGCHALHHIRFGNCKGMDAIVCIMGNYFKDMVQLFEQNKAFKNEHGKEAGKSIDDCLNKSVGSVAEFLHENNTTQMFLKQIG